MLQIITFHYYYLQVSDPLYNLEPTHKYNIQRRTTNLKISYYVKDSFSSDFTGSLKKLEREVEDVYIQRLRDACTCWTGDDMTKYSDEVKSCKIEAVSDIAKGLKACKAAFSKCRQYEDAAISTIQSCSQSADQLKAKAEALSKNKDALNDVKAKIAKATARRRHARAPATDCAGFLKLVQEGN